MSRFNKFLGLSILIIFILACNTVTGPISDAQNLAGTAQAFASEMPVETLQALASQIPVETLQALPSAAPTIEALASQFAPVGDMLNPQGTPVSEWNSIPVMPQATAGEEFQASSTYSFKVDATIQEAEDYYKTELEKLGWSSLFSMPATGNAAVLSFQKDSSVVTITITDVSGSVVVWITTA